jgi:hypothetical protein
VPAGSTVALECTVEVVRAGPFEGQIHVYYDDAGLREIVLKVQGEAHEVNHAGP